MLKQAMVIPDSRVKASPLGMLYTIRINDDIGHPSEWVEEVETIESATEADVLLLKINSNGGRLDTTLEMIAALKKTPARVICEITGTAASAASMLFLCGDELILNDGVDILVHSCSYGAVGKSKDVIDQVQHTARNTDKIFRQIYEGFLTDDEMDNVLHGMELFLDVDQIGDRLDKRLAYFEQQVIDELPEEEKPLTREKAQEMEKSELLDMMFGVEEVEPIQVEDPPQPLEKLVKYQGVVEIKIGTDCHIITYKNGFQLCVEGGDICDEEGILIYDYGDIENLEKAKEFVTLIGKKFKRNENKIVIRGIIQDYIRGVEEVLEGV